jgi:sarcosine/dimethylglycine N-methyltransferase
VSVVQGTATLADVQNVYGGAEGRLWELVMGEQIHIGGLASSMDLAKRAGIAEGSAGVDLCCCTGAGMRFLVRFCKVAKMTGVDATPRMVKLGQERCAEEGLALRVHFVEADVCRSGLPDGAADFVWGEDAWCYVEDKGQLIREAARITRTGGTIAFTDWVEGPAGLSEAEAERFISFMKFPNVQSIGGYRGLLADAGCEVVAAEDTGRFPAYVDLYLNMLNMQLSYDALKIIGWDMALMEVMGKEMQFMQGLAHARKIVQGLFVARVK